MAKDKKNFLSRFEDAPGVVELTAICEAARKRGMSYGTFVCATTKAERNEIVEKYRKGRRR